MKRIYGFVALVGKRFFRATRLPIPRGLRKVDRAIRSWTRRERRDLGKEVDALAQSVERLEAAAYLDRIGDRAKR